MPDVRRRSRAPPLVSTGSRLLLDQNLSARLVPELQEPFEGTVHVRGVELDRASDEQVWEYARDEGFTIVSKDTDFYQGSILFGHPRRSSGWRSATDPRLP